MRTVEVLFVIIIILGAFMVATYFAVLPSPRQIFGTNLREIAVSTLQTLDAKYDLSRIVFEDDPDAWAALQKALSASLPPNVVYNLTVFSINSTGGVVTYQLMNSISNAEGDLGVGSESASALITSSEVIFGITPEKIGEREGKLRTLYILNCDDSNGWWITGYTTQTLASDLYNLLSPYFQTTILVNTTQQMGLLLDGTSLTNTTLTGERVQDAVVINTCGEAVPIPSGYADQYSQDSYARYCYVLGQRVNQYDWTWVSIVGYPLYYVTNTGKFSDSHNSWGIYGMRHVGAGGLNAFLRGIDDRGYSYDGSWITGSPGLVQFSSYAYDLSNYYGLYPSPYQTATRALPDWIMDTYDLEVQPSHYVFDPVDGWIAGATFSHEDGGALTAIGLTRIPDIRLTALALLMYFRPDIFRSEFGASDTQRLVTLQLAQQGGT